MANIDLPKENTFQSGALRRQCLGFKEVLGGALGGMGLCGTVIIGIPIVFARVGAAAWLIFLMAMCAFLLVALHVNVFARRIATHGSLCDFVTTVFGSRVGAVAGWLLVLGYTASVPAYLACLPDTLISGFQHAGGGGAPGSGTLVAAGLATALLASALTIGNVTLSTRAILAVEVVSLGLLAWGLGKYLPEPGVLLASLPPDMAEIRPSLAGLALAMVCFTGFEAASVFGIEAKRPLTTIPRVNLATVLVTGVVTVVASAAMIGVVQRVSPAGGDHPFTSLIDAGDLSWGLPAILGAAVLSWFGCLLACLNTGGRLLYTLALAGHFWPAARAVHPRLATPVAAIALIAGVGLTISSVLLIGGFSAMEILVDTLSLAACGFLSAYALVAAAAGVDRWRHGPTPLKWAYVLSGALTIALMLLPLIGLLAIQE